MDNVAAIRSCYEPCYRFSEEKIVEFHTFGSREAADSMLRQAGVEIPD
jgi:hypothetical protein